MLLRNEALNRKRLERQHIIKLIIIIQLCRVQRRLRIWHLDISYFLGPAIKDFIAILRLARMVETVVVGLVIVFSGRFGVIDEWMFVSGFGEVLFVCAGG
jgi:hypothetical protein